MKISSDRQKEIINVSIELIAQEGIQALTIKNISNRMGFTEPAIYRHFKDKMDICLHILDLFEESTKSLIDNISKKEISRIDKIKMLFLEKCDNFSDNPALASVIFSEEIFRNEKLLAKRVESIMKMNGAFISKLIKEAQIKKEINSNIPTEHFAMIILGSLRLIVTKWRLSEFSFDLKKESKALWTSLEKMIKFNI